MKINVIKVRELIKVSKLTQVGFCEAVGMEPASLIRAFQEKTMLSLINIIKIADYAKIVDIRELIIYELKY